MIFYDLKIYCNVAYYKLEFDFNLHKVGDNVITKLKVLIERVLHVDPFSPSATCSSLTLKRVPPTFFRTFLKAAH